MEIIFIAWAFWWIIWCVFSKWLLWVVYYLQIFRMELNASLESFISFDWKYATIFVLVREKIFSVTSVWYSIIDDQSHDCLKRMVSTRFIKISSKILSHENVTINFSTSSLNSVIERHSVGWLMIKKLIDLHVCSMIHGCKIKSFIELIWIKRLEIFHMFISLSPASSTFKSWVIAIGFKWKCSVINKAVQFLFNILTELFRIGSGFVNIKQKIFNGECRHSETSKKYLKWLIIPI